MKYRFNHCYLPRLEEIRLDQEQLKGGISVFLPAYNEEGNIERAVKNSVEVLQSITDDYEVLVVNDASTDRTAEIVEALSAQNPRIRMVTHRENTRLGGAIRTGFGETTKKVVFYCDADNPVNMWDVKRALPLLDKYDLIAGFRIQREPIWYRRLYSFVYNSMVAVLFGIDAFDINFSFKLVKREVLDKVELYSNGGFIDVEFMVEAAKNNFKICRVGVEYFPRTAGVSTMASFSVILKIFLEMGQYILRCWRKRWGFQTVCTQPDFICSEEEN